MDSVDFRRFLPLLHSQAPWTEILAGEKSSKAKIFPTQFPVKPLRRLRHEGVLEDRTWARCALPLTHKP